MKASPKFIVAIGTSTGGIKAVEEVLGQLTAEMDAAFFIVHHVSRKGIGDILLYRLQHFSKLPVKLAMDGERFERGVVYIATFDEHLLLSKDHLMLRKSAAENGWRPSINNLFRSAAANHSSKVIGIILTGLLDDGTSGMASIQRAGGITIVQDPNEADNPDMPLSVMENIKVNHVESLGKMGALLTKIMEETEPREVRVPFDIIQEVRIDERLSTRIEDLVQFEKSPYNCPNCGAALSITQKEYPTHYRCHIGHSYTDRELMLRYSEVMESHIWITLRMLEEQRTLNANLQEKEKERGYESVAAKHQERAVLLEKQIIALKELLHTVSKDD